jgi:hypothetical protein
MKVRFEYRSVFINAPFNQIVVKELNEAGEDGWEVIHVNSSGVALLKRSMVVMDDGARSLLSGSATHLC